MPWLSRLFLVVLVALGSGSTGCEMSTDGLTNALHAEATQPRRGAQKARVEAVVPEVVAPPSEAPRTFDVQAGVEPSIEAWSEALRRCHRRPRRFCDGPRRTPAAHGDAAVRAERLGLGGKQAYHRILSGPVSEALLAEIPGDEESLTWPVPDGTRGRGFGYVRRQALRGRLHRGVDMPAAVGARVRAAKNGLVIYADNSVRGYGNLVVLLHADDTRTFYAHLDAAYVFAGQTVERGAIIGDVGRTGMTRAAHLHFEFRRRAVPRSPRRLFVDRPSPERERELLREQLERRREGEARLAELRERAERRRARREREEQGS